MNQELPDVQDGFTKRRGTRDQIANMCWSIAEKAMAPTPVLLPGKPHGQRSLIGYRPWGCKELDMTERLHFSILLMQSHLSVLRCSMLVPHGNSSCFEWFYHLWKITLFWAMQDIQVWLQSTLHFASTVPHVHHLHLGLWHHFLKKNLCKSRVKGSAIKNHAP